MKYICIFNVFSFQPLRFSPLLPGPRKRTSCYSDNWLSTLAAYWNNMGSFKLCFLGLLPNNSDFFGPGWGLSIVSFRSVQMTCSQGDPDHLTLSHISECSIDHLHQKYLRHLFKGQIPRLHCKCQSTISGTVNHQLTFVTRFSDDFAFLAFLPLSLYTLLPSHCVMEHFQLHMLSWRVAYCLQFLDRKDPFPIQ